MPSFYYVLYGSVGRHKKKNKGGAARGRPTRLQALLDASERIVMNSERYNLWWTGPPESKTFTRGKYIRICASVWFIARTYTPWYFLRTGSIFVRLLELLMFYVFLLLSVSILSIHSLICLFFHLSFLLNISNYLNNLNYLVIW